MKKKPMVLITGANSGLGRKLANKIIDYKTDLCLIARRKQLLEEVKEELLNKDPTLNVYVFDGTISNEQFVKDIFIFLEKNHYYPQYVINCAGVGEFGSAEISNKEMIDRVLEANLIGLILMCSNALQHMKSHESFLINIMSTAALRGKANETVYCAAKWGARGYTEALKKEVENLRVHVIGVYPGGMNTNFWEKNCNNKIRTSNFIDPTIIAQEIIDKIFNNSEYVDLIFERAK